MPRGAGRGRGVWGALLTQPVRVPGMWLSFLWDAGRRRAGGFLGWGGGGRDLAVLELLGPLCHIQVPRPQQISLHDKG